MSRVLLKRRGFFLGFEIIMMINKSNRSHKKKRENRENTLIKLAKADWETLRAVLSPLCYARPSKASFSLSLAFSL